MQNKNILVTGGAGFVGSHLVDALIRLGNNVTIFDNLSTGKTINFGARFIKKDLLHDTAALSDAMIGIDFVFHLAAHADIKDNVNEPLKCYDQNITVTRNVLEAMRANDVKNIAFSSTGSVYGDSAFIPTPEDAPFPVQTSIYGATKASCECLLQSYSESFGFNVYIFRFVSLLGERYSHGCVIDFYGKLLLDTTKLLILGDGKQYKSYLYVKDCIDGMLLVIDKSKERVNIYNLGHDECIDVTSIAKIVCESLGVKGTKFIYSGNNKGWIGDNPHIHLNIDKIKDLGWKPTLSIKESIERTVDYLGKGRGLVSGRENLQS